MDISVVIPIYNEQDNIDLVYKKIKGVFLNLLKQYELIFVNDGSTDNSLNFLKNIMAHDNCIKVLSFDRNYGKTSALDVGFKNAKGHIILTIDGDLQYDPTDLVTIAKELEGQDVDAVLGRRINRNSGFIKNISSKLAVLIRNFILKEDYQECYLAGYKKSCLKNLVLYRGFQDFIPSLLRLEGYNIKEIDVMELPRRYGKSKYGIKNRLFKGLFTLFVMKWMKTNKLRYKIIDI